MTSRPPLYSFRAFTPDRVTEVRAARELAWAKALNPPEKKLRKTSSARSPKPTVIPSNVPPELAELMRQTLKKLNL